MYSFQLGVALLYAFSSAGNCHASQLTLIKGMPPSWFLAAANASRNRFADA
jgi:hypothetical protein